MTTIFLSQKKLETELLQIEDKFDAKKRKFLEAGDAFQRELKKVKVRIGTSIGDRCLLDTITLLSSLE